MFYLEDRFIATGLLSTSITLHLFDALFIKIYHWLIFYSCWLICWLQTVFWHTFIISTYNNCARVFNIDTATSIWFMDVIVIISMSYSFLLINLFEFLEQVFNSIYDYFWWLLNTNESDDPNFYNVITINVFQKTTKTRKIKIVVFELNRVIFQMHINISLFIHIS